MTGTNTPISYHSSRGHPEMAAGGYASNNGTVEFYQRVVAILPEDAVVLDLGAGRGSWFNADPGASWESSLLRLGRKYSRRVGADVDPAVQVNPGIDEAKVIEPGQPLPFADQSFDLVLCDWVIEHIENPSEFVREIKRVLKVGGWFCARTPNRWSYFSVGARILRGAMGKAVLRALQPGRASEDVFPKYYRMNTLAAIQRGFPANQWLNATYTHNPDAGYDGGFHALHLLIEFYQKLAPQSLGTVVLVFVKRLA